MPRFTRLTGLFATRKGTGYTGRLRDGIALPADARLLVQPIREQDRKANGPTHELVWVREEEATFGERKDAPERAQDAAAVAQAVELQRPRGRPDAARDLGLGEEEPW